MQTESLKGRPCPNKPITCQEGWCNECELGIIGKIRAKRDMAFAGSAYGSREKKMQLQAMVSAYDIVLRLMGGNDEN